MISLALETQNINAFLRVHRAVNLIKKIDPHVALKLPVQTPYILCSRFTVERGWTTVLSNQKWPSEKSITFALLTEGEFVFSHFRPASGRHRQTARGKQPDKRLFVDSDKAIMRPWVVQRLPGLQMSVWKKVTGCTAGCSLDFIRLMRPRRSRPNVMTLFKGKAAEAFWMSLKKLKWKRLVISFKGPLHRF